MKLEYMYATLQSAQFSVITLISGNEFSQVVRNIISHVFQ